MSISDRLWWILADGTPEQKQWEELVGKPSSSLIGTAHEDTLVLDEYVSTIDTTQPATSFQQRLAVYGNQPAETFSILA